MEPTPSQQLMIADGLPAAAIIPPEERRQSWASRPSAAQPAKEFAMTTETTKPSKADQVASLRVARATRKGSKTEAKERVSAALGRPLTPAKAKKAAKAPAKPQKPAASKPAKSTGVRPGSKLETIVGLLRRKEGCTTADVLKVTDWPAVSMPQQAKAAGLTLRKEKDGKTTRYWAA